MHCGDLSNAPVEREPFFGLDVVKKCPGVPDEILVPRNTWADSEAYDQVAAKLARLFHENFKTYSEGVSAAVRAAGPRSPQVVS